MRYTSNHPSSLFPTFSRIFDDFWGDFTQDVKQVNSIRPAVNISESEVGFSLDFVLPGFSKEEVKIEVEKDQLTVKAGREKSEEEDKTAYLRKEFNLNTYARSFTLPKDIDADQIVASFENGILNLHLPKATPKPEESPKRIQIA